MLSGISYFFFCVISKFLPAFHFASADIEGLCATRVAKLVRSVCQAKWLNLYSLGAKKKGKTQADVKKISLEKAMSCVGGTEMSIDPGDIRPGLKSQLIYWAGELGQVTEPFSALVF